MDQEPQAKTCDANSSTYSPTAHHNHEKPYQTMVEDYPDQGKQVPANVTQLHQPLGTSSPNPPFYILTQKATSDDDGSPVTRHSHHGSLTSSNESPERTSSRVARPHQPRQYEYTTGPVHNHDFQSAQSNAFQPSSPNAYQYQSRPSTFISTPNTLSHPTPQEPTFTPGLNGPAWPQGSYNWTQGYPSHGQSHLESQGPFQGQGPPQFSPVPGYPPEAPHGSSYPHHGFNPDRPDIHQRGLTFPPPNINSPPHSATLPPMEDGRWDEKLPCSEHVGYALVAARMAGDVKSQTSPMYRRFRRLSHRLLLSYQVRLADLERELHIQDSIEASDREGSSRVSELEQRVRADNGDVFLRNRFDVLDRIEDILIKYNQLLVSASWLERFAMPDEKSISDFKRFLNVRANIRDSETDLFDDREDLLTLSRRSPVSAAKHEKTPSEVGNSSSQIAPELGRNQGDVAAVNFATVLAIAMPLMAVWEPSWIMRCLFAVGCAFVLLCLRFGHLGRVKEFVRNQLS